VRLRPRAAGLIVGALILFLVGTNVQAGWLFVIAALMLGAAVAGIALPARMVRGVEVTRRAAERAFQGDALRVELTITNRSRGMRASLLVRDPFVADAEVFVSHLAPGERAELVTERVASRRGPQGADAVELRSDAPFAVAERRRRIEAAGAATILPRVEPLGDLAFIDLAPTAERAMHPWPRRGGGPEYLGIREYRAGDSMRHVHWPSTARHGTVMVRELEAESTRRLAIVVDASSDEGTEWTPLDAACSAAASVALAAAARGQGVRLVAGPHEPAAVGEEELLERLATLQPDGRPIAGTIRGAIGSLRGIESAFVVLPTWRTNAPDDVVPSALTLAEETGRLAVLLVDAASRGAPPKVCLPESAVVGLREALGRAGLDVHRWSAGEPLADALATTLAGEGVPA
jgi:uncharacterized protein (DUF58 family)